MGDDAMDVMLTLAANTPAFFLPSAASPALTIGNPNFGKLTASSATGRQLQFGLKLLF